MRKAPQPHRTRSKDLSILSLLELEDHTQLPSPGVSPWHTALPPVPFAPAHQSASQVYIGTASRGDQLIWLSNAARPALSAREERQKELQGGSRYVGASTHGAYTRNASSRHGQRAEKYLGGTRSCSISRQPGCTCLPREKHAHSSLSR